MSVDAWFSIVVDCSELVCGGCATISTAWAVASVDPMGGISVAVGTAVRAEAGSEGAEGSTSILSSGLGDDLREVLGVR